MEGTPDRNQLVKRSRLWPRSVRGYRRDICRGQVSGWRRERPFCREPRRYSDISGQEHWTAQTAPPDRDGSRLGLARITFAAGTFVIVGERGAILTSRDAVHWVLRDPGTFADLYAISYADGRFVAVGFRGTTLVSGNVLAASITNPIATSAGFSFELGGDTGRVYRVETATDIAASKWTAIGTVTNVFDRPIFVDPAAKNYPARFYRAVADVDF